MKKFLYTLIFTLLGTYLQAQHHISITIIDARNAMPVDGAYIIKDDGNIIRTDENGKCNLPVEPGEKIRISAPDYEPVEIVYHAGTSDTLIVKLKPAVIELDQVVITSDPLRTPVHAVTSTDLEKKYSQPRNTAELFKDLPGVSLQKRSAMSVEPALRSFKYEEMNLIYDGGFKMVNACPNRMDPASAHVIPEEVEKIEIIKGPFNVRFGQTFGAIVNMQTRDLNPDKVGLSGLVQAGYETNGQNKVGLAALTYTANKFHINTNLSYRNFGDYTDGKGDTVPAGFRSLEYSIKSGFIPAKNQRLLIDWRQNFTRNVKHAGLPMDSPKDDSYLIGMDYVISNVSSKIKGISAKMYYSYVNHLMTNGYLMDKPRPNYPTFDARTPVWSRTAGGKIEMEYRPAGNMLVYIGADADIIARDGIKTVFITRNPNTGAPWPVKKKVLNVWQDGRINDIGIYAQSSWSQSKSRIIGAGLRADYVWALAKRPAKGMIDIYGEFGRKTDVVLSANLSYTYKGPDFRIETAIGRGTRTPSMIERYIYRFIIGEDSREYIGNPFLKPEINNQIEASAVKKWGDFQAGMDLFASYFQNYITARLNSAYTPATGSCGQPPRAPKQFVNVDAYQYGFDIFATYRLTPHWKISVDYSYIKGYNMSFKEPLAQVNPPGGHVKFKYNRSNYWLDYRIEWREPKKDVAKSFGETPTPGYAVHDLMAGYKPDNHFSLGLSITNIFNKPYYYHTTFVFRNAGKRSGAHIYEPGRNISFMLTYKF